MSMGQPVDLLVMLRRGGVWVSSWRMVSMLVRAEMVGVVVVDVEVAELLARERERRSL